MTENKRKKKWKQFAAILVLMLTLTISYAACISDSADEYIGHNKY